MMNRFQPGDIIYIKHENDIDYALVIDTRFSVSNVFVYNLFYLADSVRVNRAVDVIDLRYRLAE